MRSLTHTSPRDGHPHPPRVPACSVCQPPASGRVQDREDRRRHHRAGAPPRPTCSLARRSAGALPLRPPPAVPRTPAPCMVAPPRRAWLGLSAGPAPNCDVLHSARALPARLPFFPSCRQGRPAGRRHHLHALPARPRRPARPLHARPGAQRLLAGRNAARSPAASPPSAARRGLPAPPRPACTSLARARPRGAAACSCAIRSTASGWMCTSPYSSPCPCRWEAC